MGAITWSAHAFPLLLVLLVASVYVETWETEWKPNFVVKDAAVLSKQHYIFNGPPDDEDNFRLLMVEGDKGYIGARDYLVYLSLLNATEITRLNWLSNQVKTRACKMGSMPGCANFIRVALKRGPNLFICGSNANDPMCRYYNFTDGEFVMSRKDEEVARGVCPFHPDANNSFTYFNGKMYTATMSDMGNRDPLILGKFDDNRPIRTQSRDTLFFNEPHFISSFAAGDNIFFFFRETAVENINCGKVVFSRVARVCKSDNGGDGAWVPKDMFTSFFKARLNCSIPGPYPFFFDELQSTTEFGQGNYRPTRDSGDRRDMVYGVFNTPENSIHGSAICAFRHVDIVQVFRGGFKGQETHRHNWLYVDWKPLPVPHPGDCTDGEYKPGESTYFAKSYPLMDAAVPARGGMPILTFTDPKSRFTQIAVDWQVLAADGRYYDVMFIGTNNGRIIKAINKGLDSKIEAVIIEDIQVLDHNEAVNGLRVLNLRSEKNVQRLIVVSKRRVVSIPLFRCREAKTCRACVGLQDPYCVWREEMNQCMNAEKGLQNIQTGTHSSCEPDPVVPEPIVTTPAPAVTPACVCDGPRGSQEAGDRGVNNLNRASVNDTNNKMQVRADASKVSEAGGTALEIVIVAIIVSVLVSLIIGFIIGFKLQSCRQAHDRDSVFYDQNCSSLQRGRNRLSSGDNPYFHTDQRMLAPKQMNYVVNLKNGKPNAGLETRPVTKCNKVYL